MSASHKLMRARIAARKEKQRMQAENAAVQKTAEDLGVQPDSYTFKRLQQEQLRALGIDRPELDPQSKHEIRMKALTRMRDVEAEVIYRYKLDGRRQEREAQWRRAQNIVRGANAFTLAAERAREARIRERERERQKEYSKRLREMKRHPQRVDSGIESDISSLELSSMFETLPDPLDFTSHSKGKRPENIDDPKVLEKASKDLTGLLGNTLSDILFPDDAKETPLNGDKDTFSGVQKKPQNEDRDTVDWLLFGQFAEELDEFLNDV